MPLLPRLVDPSRLGSPLPRLGAAARSRPYHLALTALAVGLGLGGAAAQPARPAAAAAALLAGLLSAARAPGVGLAAAAALVAGALGGHARVEAVDRGVLAVKAPASLRARAVMLEHPRRSQFGTRAALRITSGPGAGEQVLARASLDLRWPRDAGAGTEVAVAGALSRPSSKPGADFDWPAYLRRRGIRAELELDTLRGTGARRGGAAGAIDSIRRRAERGIETGLPPPRAALARGMVLGQDEDVPEPLKEDFRTSGLGHVLAVSGQNVMLLCALALPFLMASGAGPRTRVIVLLGLIALYVPLAGAGPSLQRAGAMGAAGLVATLAGRPASRMYALLLAAVGTLAMNPLATGDVGWQLSFAAVAGILWLGPALRRPLAGLPTALAETIVMTVAATVATAPLLAHHFGALSVASLPANLLAAPSVAGTMWIGMVEAALGQAAGTGGPAGALVAALLDLAGAANGVCLAAVAGIAETFAQAPGAQLSAELGSPAAVAAAYAALIVAVLGARTLARRAGPAATAYAAAWRRQPRTRRTALALAVVAVLVLTGARWLGPPAPPDRLTVSFLDVGQGDATLVQSPEGGAVLFDGGPPEARVHRLLRRAGVRRLSAVVATHQSRDHQGGLAEVLEEIPSDLYVDGGDGNRDPAFLAIAATARRRGIKRIVPRRGDTLRLPGLTVRFIGPPPRPPGPAPEDPNPRALVSVVSAAGFDLFLSGDAESPSLVPLRLPRVDAMKVSHHGSRDEGLPAVLRRLRPKVAAIEVGEGNSYGHPAPETLAALRRAGPAVYRTDRDGTIKLSVDGGGMEVETEP